MSLSSALGTARNGLRATSSQISLVSQNVSGARDPNYNRRITGIERGANGYMYATARRETNLPLLTNYMTKNTNAASADVLAKGIMRISSAYSDDDFADSPARRMGGLRDALQLYYNQYDQIGTGDAAIVAAKKLSASLNQGNDHMSQIRFDADRDIEACVTQVNNLLARFHEVDTQIVKSVALGRDEGAYLDQRDAILKELSENIGITAVVHSDGGMALYGIDGSTFYDKGPRSVTFTPSVALPAGYQGGMVMVDGVPLDHGSFMDPVGGGTIGGLLKLRDDVVPRYQTQLDEVAAALVDMFKGPPDLFLDGGDASHTGLAGRISLNDAFDVSAGGKAALLGDRDRILQLVDKFSETRSYDPRAGLADGTNLIKFTEFSRSWIEAERKEIMGVVDFHNTQVMRAGEALSNETGVNSDEEMALMLQLEQSYAATARLIATVGKVFDNLLAAI